MYRLEPKIRNETFKIGKQKVKHRKLNCENDIVLLLEQVEEWMAENAETNKGYKSTTVLGTDKNTFADILLMILLQKI